MVWFLLVLGIFLVPAHAKTDQSDASALKVMFSSLNNPSQLTGWKANGGDPCGESWKGITCSGSSVKEIRLSDLGLTGSMGYQLSSLTSVTYFDMRKNNLKGDIPYQLPPNVQQLYLSGNGFTGNVPYSISLMPDLKTLDLGHNQLKGELTDMFGQLRKLNSMDLSSNSFSGDLPKSFGSLSSLKSLHLENNQFSGPIDVLAKLPLNELDVENNRFTGSVPEKLRDIDTIITGGNAFSSGANLNKQSNSSGSGNGLSGPAIAGIVIGVLVGLAILIALISFIPKSSSSATHYLEDERLSQRRSFTPLVSRELSIGKPNNFKEMKTLEPSPSVKVKSLQISPSMGLKRPPSEHVSSLSDAEFASRLNVRRSTSIRAVTYSLADLQAATGNFATGRLVGEGSIGRVYRAKYPDGKV